MSVNCAIPMELVSSSHTRLRDSNNEDVNDSLLNFTIRVVHVSIFINYEKTAIGTRSQEDNGGEGAT